MKAPTTTAASPDFNMLVVGNHYEADTGSMTLEGEYLGVETPYGERSMLLRDVDGKSTTIPFRFVRALRMARSAPNSVV